MKKDRYRVRLQNELNEDSYLPARTLASEKRDQSEETRRETSSRQAPPRRNKSKKSVLAGLFGLGKEMFRSISSKRTLQSVQTVLRRQRIVNNVRSMFWRQFVSSLNYSKIDDRVKLADGGGFSSSGSKADNLGVPSSSKKPTSFLLADGIETEVLLSQFMIFFFFQIYDLLVDFFCQNLQSMLILILGFFSKFRLQS